MKKPILLLILCIVVVCWGVANLKTASEWVNFWSAVSTVFVAILAIWGDEIKEALVGPKLRLKIKNSTGERNTCKLNPNDPTLIGREDIKSIVASEATESTIKGRPLELSRQCRYRHLSVENARDTSVAKNVHVKCVAIQRRGKDNKFENSRLYIPIPMIYSYSDLNLPYFPLNPTVGPPQTCDLVTLVQGATAARIQILFQPYNVDPYIRGGEHVRCIFQAESSNGSSPEFSVEISWDGKWSDDDVEMATHLVVRESSHDQQ